MDNKTKEIVKDLLTGIGLWVVLTIVIGCLFLHRDTRSYICGVLVGGGAAVFLVYNMHRHLDIALSSMDMAFAESHVRKWAMIRLFIMALVVGGAMVFYTYVHPVGVVVGIWGLKVAAWLQPKVHKYRALLCKSRKK